MRGVPDTPVKKDATHLRTTEMVRAINNVRLRLFSRNNNKKSAMYFASSYKEESFGAAAFSNPITSLDSSGQVRPRFETRTPLMQLLSNPIENTEGNV